MLYYDCTNYYFEIEEEKGSRKYGKGKEHRPNPIIQMGLFMDAGLGSEAIREFNHMGERAFIVTQSIKKLKSEEKEWALSPTGFRRVSDGRAVDLSTLPQDDCGLYYKEQPYTPKEIHQRLIITYSPKYARYQKAVRERQVDRAREMLEKGKKKRNGKKPNDPARFIASTAVTREGEKAEIYLSLNEEKIADEAQYDGLYAVCTDLLDDDASGILKVSEERWQIEETNIPVRKS